MRDNQTVNTSLSSLQLAHGNLELPAFLPDATYGMVRAVDAIDLVNCRVQALVMNTFHLMQKPGTTAIQSLGGLHCMSGWSRPIFTDSGGFQAYSLIHLNPKFGSLSERGLSFQPEGAPRKFQLTPEKSIQLQVGYGSDVVICLDDCTHVDAPASEQEAAVRRTIAWAKRGKAEFERLVEQKKLAPGETPKLFAVVQGGGLRALRKACAESLLEIGFDGFGYGGWPLDQEGNLLEDILGYTRELIPTHFPMHALGVGHPYNVAACYHLGYALFDSAMPTRDARHARLYAFAESLENQPATLGGKWLRYIYIEDERYIRSNRPISPNCDCPVCSRYSLGYLRHLFKMNDSLFPRLATLHNLRFMTMLTAQLAREAR
ncbi:MAG: queuine tRNA-ribosyltransferase family protein [Anaerolineaceae bacterium]|nr:queuine tRNA-ribosyltransferase family protein [Anaerolineaceae bacterium]